jgi:hypothetical protein
METTNPPSSNILKSTAQVGIKYQLYVELIKLSEQIAKAGFPYTLFDPALSNPKSWTYFDSLPITTQQKIYDDFIVYSKLMNSVVAENKDLSDNTSTLWAAIKNLGALPTNEIFTQLEADDVIEIYRNDGLQVFRNFRFHEVCSYQLHDLFIRSWDDLFIRDPSITKEIQEGAYLTFTGQVKGIRDMTHIPSHYLFEKDSPGMFVMKIKIRFIAPLRDKLGGIPYGICVSKVEVLEKERTVEPVMSLDF